MQKEVVSGQKIILEPLVEAHIDAYLRQYSGLVQALLHVSDLQYERHYLHKRIRENAFFYILKHKEMNRLIGAIEIRDPAYRSQLYCWLNQLFWGNGIFQEAMQLLIPVYFLLSGSKSIFARVDCKNTRSFYALQKVGFRILEKVPGPYGPQYQMILEYGELQ